MVLVQSDGSVVLFCASKPGRATQAPESNRTEWGAFGRSLAAACKGAARLSVTRSATIEKAGRFFGWKSRWLVLLSSRLLLYFEDASGCCLCGAIDLERADCDIGTVMRFCGTCCDGDSQRSSSPTRYVPQCPQTEPVTHSAS